MHQLAWIRLMVARHPWTYWLALALVASLVALGAAKAAIAVDTARKSWGDQRSVWVASGPVAPGDPIVAVERVVPVAVVPPGAVSTSPVGSIARQRVGPGEIITEVDVSPTGTRGLIPPDWVAFAVPAPVDHFAIGDPVAIYAGGDLISAGLIVHVGESDSMIAVPADAAPQLAAALLANAVTIALTP